MKTCYMAFAKFTDGNREWFTNISKHDTQDEAETQAEDFHKKYAEAVKYAETHDCILIQEIGKQNSKNSQKG